MFGFCVTTVHHLDIQVGQVLQSLFPDTIFSAPGTRVRATPGLSLSVIFGDQADFRRDLWGRIPCPYCFEVTDAEYLGVPPEACR